MKETINLIKGDKIGVETDYRDALPVNMYAVKHDILGAKGYMIAYPGLTQFAPGSGADRGANYNERHQRHYRLSGTQLISVDPSGNSTELGEITGSSQARMIDLYSFNTQGIIVDGNFFLCDSGGTLSQVTDADLGAPIDGVWIDGYYFLTDGEYVYHTDIDDETAIDPLKFATAEFMPDPSLGVSKTADNKVIVWGRYSAEYFVDIAQDNFAFQRVETRAQKIGIVATHAKCESEGFFYITGGYRDSSVGVYIVQIGSSIKISTREVDKILAQYSEPELSDMRMETRTENDVTFILIHLPNETLCFNASIAKVFGNEFAWSLLKSGLTGTANYRGINGIFDSRNGKWLYGDKTSVNIAELDNTKFTQFGTIQEWVLYTPLLNLETTSVDEIEAETIPGHTTTNDATVAISITFDGIHYGTEWFKMYGLPSNYSTRFIIRRLGYISNMIGFKLRGATKSRMAFAFFRITYS